MDKLFETLQGDSPLLQTIGKYGYKVYEQRELILMYTHLLASALFPIYIGSHASLQRPPSAKAAPKAKKTSTSDDEDDDLDEEPTREGLSPSDAILFPLLAGITLGFLYYVIKILKKPELLNKILNYYFSCIGVFGVGKLAADSLNVVTSFIFPNVWSDSTSTYYIDPLLSQQVTGEVKRARTQTHRKFTDKSNPFPGIFSSLGLSDRLQRHAWSLRALVKKHWILRASVHGIATSKSKIRLNDIIGLLIGLITITLYNTAAKPWWLTNIIGFGFCYGTLQLMSPTTFFTGSLVLIGLFFYDIVMVFYTPLMVTVATQLDAPIKLVIPGGKGGRGGMLGLGDVVLPGIMMALALRFDLYLHYHYLGKKSQPTTYVEATGSWGDRFWTQRLSPASPPLDDGLTTANGGSFKKTYFNASLIGYVFAMLVTLYILNVYNHAQPALLYLVPGVLIALWGTAVVRGESGLMWGYTEDGSIDVDGGEQKGNEEKKDEEGKKEDEEEKNKKKEKSEGQSHHVFLFSLSEPKTRGSVLGNGKLGKDVQIVA